MKIKTAKRPGVIQDSGEVILVNRAHPLGHEREPRLRRVAGAPGVLLERRTALALEAWLEAAGCKGAILPVSGWRSRGEQEDIYRGAIVDHGWDFAETFVAWPGCSEHETGLAVDLTLAGEDIDPITPELPYDGVAAPLRKLAASFGFVERYPAGKRGVTGIGHEPWHFRYLGSPHAEMLTQTGLVLEEYNLLLRGHPWLSAPLEMELGGERWTVGYLAEGDLDEFFARAVAGLHFSSDNAGGYLAAGRLP